MTHFRLNLSEGLANSMKDFKAAWKSGSTKVSKPWGDETIWWSMTSGVRGKILHIRAGERTSLKYFPLKNETLFMLAGKAEVYYGDEASLVDETNHPFTLATFSPGDALHVQSGCPYRIIAIEDSQIIEISSHSSEEPVRIEDDYDRIGSDVES
jgi:mannose-6-phosphate isomerase-like protein (cupin superfamily)